MSAVLRRLSGSLLLAGRQQQQQHLLQKASIHGKPPKEKIGPLATVVCLSVFAVTLLGPAGWILHQLPECRKRD